MCKDNGNPFIATLHTILLAPYLWDRLYSIITLMDLGNTCLFYKGFCTVYFRDKKENTVTLQHSSQRKHGFLVKTK